VADILDTGADMTESIAHGATRVPALRREHVHHLAAALQELRYQRPAVYQRYTEVHLECQAWLDAQVSA
jgi:hypothetical protein